VGCRTWISGQAPANAATGASTKPIASAIASRSGVSARMPITSAPASASGVMMSIPSTQRTVAVDRATVRVSRSTSTAAQNRPAPTDSRTRSHAMEARPGWNAASGALRRVSGDTYRIPGPHEPREVVAGAHHVQVDVLPEVEARILIRAAEAPDVEVEDDEAR